MNRQDVQNPYKKSGLPKRIKKCYKRKGIKYRRLFKYLLNNNLCIWGLETGSYRKDWMNNYEKNLVCKNIR